MAANQAFKGYVKVKISGHSLERFLNLCSFHQIEIWGLSAVEDGCELFLYAADFRRMKPLLKKTETHIQILQKSGVPFFLFRNRKRKAFFIGGGICIFLVWLYSCFIWDIRFQGNCFRTDEEMVRFLKEQGIEPGIRSSRIKCEEIVKKIRKEFDDIIWVSAYVEGSVLKICIRENDDLSVVKKEKLQEEQKEKKEKNMDIAMDLIAQKDAVIQKIVTRQGIPAVHEGDQVKKGDLLVSGRIELLNDAKEVTGYQSCKADADIWGNTEISYQKTIPLSVQEKRYDKKEERRTLFIQLGKYRLFLGIDPGMVVKKGQEIREWEEQMKIGENWLLPVKWGCIRKREYDIKTKKRSSEKLQEILSLEFSRFCVDLQKKGVQIIENDVKIQIDENQAAATGSLSLIEPIGELKISEYGTEERNSVDESFGNNH